MLINESLILIIMAGIMNGSFVIPTRYIKSASKEMIWLNHSVLGLIIIPWALLLIMQPAAASQYSNLSTNDIWFLISGGFIFGIGQVCFAYAIGLVGMALGFAINLGLGVTIGSMFVVFYKSAFFSTQGNMVTLSVLLIIGSLVIYYFAGKNNNPSSHTKDNRYHKGWALASIAGVASGLQNIAFVTVANHASTIFKTTNSFWVWPPFLLAAAIPMFIGFLHRAKKNASHIHLLGLHDICLIFIMGLFFTGSLALYSSGMSHLTHQQEIIGWPAFMVAIILTSQLWGKRYKEVNTANAKSKTLVTGSILLLIIAIVILSISK